MITPEHETLASRYLDGTATEDELTRLDGLVRESPEFARYLHEMATQDAMIAHALVELEAIRAEELASARGRVVTVAAELWRSWWMRSVVAAAAALVVCVGGFNVRQARQAEKAVVASVVEVWGQVARGKGQGAGGTGDENTQHSTPNIQRSSGGGIKVGGTIRPGDGVVVGEDGYVKLAYADGTLVELQKNTAMTLGAGRGIRLFGLVKELRGKRIQLEGGTLAARVAKQKAGEAMALATPHATATVLGTKLQLVVTPESSLLSVQTGQVAFATATQQDVVSAGESARVQDGVLRKVIEPPAVVAGSEYRDGAILFQDSFAQGFGKWVLYTQQGTGERSYATEKQCPGISIIEADCDGVPSHVAALTGGVPAGKRVGIATRDIGCKSAAFSLNYAYTYEGRDRLAMEGIKIYMETLVLVQGRTLPKAKPAGQWNQVRWEVARTGEPTDKEPISYEAKLFFNGEYLGRRTENYGDSSPGLMLEVIDGQFRFANVVIRELRKIEEAGGPGRRPYSGQM